MNKKTKTNEHKDLAQTKEFEIERKRERDKRKQNKTKQRNEINFSETPSYGPTFCFYELNI